MSNSFKKMRSFYIHYLLKERKLFLALVIISIVVALLLGLYTYFLKTAYDNIFGIFSEKQMYRTCAFLFVSIFAYFAAYSIRSYLVTKIRYSLLQDIQFNYIEELFAYDYNFFIKTRTEDIMKCMVEDCIFLANGFSQIALLVSNALIAFLWVLCFALFVSWMLYIFAGAMLLIALWLIVWHRPIVKSSHEIGLSYGVMYRLFGKVIYGIKVIKLELLSKFIMAELADASRGLEKNVRSNVISSNSLYNIVIPIPWAVFLIILFFGVHQMRAGNFTFGLLTVSLMFAYRVLEPLFEMMPIVMSIRESKMALERINGLFISESEKSGNEIFNGLRNEINFENVSFAYQSSSFMIENLNLSIRRGETVAFIGKSGTGKSTIVNMLLRLQRQSSGRILLDGRDIDDYAINSVRENIVLIHQDTTFFVASMRDNINFKNRIDDRHLDSILSELGLVELISKLPDGMDTIIRNNGDEFSGGERQRLALARGLSINAGCYVFDEITANVDPFTESIILDSIFKRESIETKIFVTHNIKILSRMDRIFLLESEHGLIDLDNKTRKVDIDKLIDFCSGNGSFPGDDIYCRANEREK